MSATQLAIRDKTEAQHRFQVACARFNEALKPVVEAAQQMLRQLTDVFAGWAEMLGPLLRWISRFQAARTERRRAMHYSYRLRQLARKRRR